MVSSSSFERPSAFDSKTTKRPSALTLCVLPTVLELAAPGETAPVPLGRLMSCVVEGVPCSAPALPAKAADAARAAKNAGATIFGVLVTRCIPVPPDLAWDMAPAWQRAERAGMRPACVSRCGQPHPRGVASAAT